MYTQKEEDLSNIEENRNIGWKFSPQHHAGSPVNDDIQDFLQNMKHNQQISSYRSPRKAPANPQPKFNIKRTTQQNISSLQSKNNTVNKFYA